MKALTIKELNSIDTLKNKQIYEQEKLNMETELCFSYIANVLKREWHNVSKEPHIIYNMVNNGWGADAFEIVCREYLKEGIEISYYRPHCFFSVKLK